jgi:hypothetical protein
MKVHTHWRTVAACPPPAEHRYKSWGEKPSAKKPSIDNASVVGCPLSVPLPGVLGIMLLTMHRGMPRRAERRETERRETEALPKLP